MKNTATDPYSGGRNFAGHFACASGTSCPVSSSPIEVQYSMAPAPRWRRSATAATGITIVTGGDAGTAEGDFATLPGVELAPGQRAADAHHRHEQPVGHLDAVRRPSTASSDIADRGKAFGMPTADHRRQRPRGELPRAEEGDRRTCAPSASRTCSRPMVSRLYGHSSRVGRELRHGRGRLPRASSRSSLEAHGVLTRAEMDEVRAQLHARSSPPRPGRSATSRMPDGDRRICDSTSTRRSR